MTMFEDAKIQVVNAAQLLTHKGFLSATGGNLSVRIAGQKAFAITPSNYDYMKMVPEDICVLDFDLQPLAGERKPSVESGMHGAIYQARGDVNAIIHTHQVYPSTLAILNMPIPALFDEQVRFLGRSVDIIPYAPSGTGMLKNTVARHVSNHNNAYIMANHGALLFGHDLERAMHNVEVLEKCALAYLLAVLSEKKVSKIPLPIRELAFAKLRKDQKRVESGNTQTGGE
ncbi:MAG TPA: class II aldolase/adducin family protein [Anaerolineaceae bacterium]|nr:class II aldolase/adducin family protein [Longilinea sp.]HQF62409.1 class II aldolase/adducin family protein [Anaerolineaceae bacterium]HQH85653.1 class II aldolase/adducin family protein [Anaerolineaceae bacterium]HQN43459.1 class II aldolase/adducin family protein [Anaerolineaceae bacterium]